ncbi:outer membrane protein [Arenicella xantha]|uniref:Outer membrane protein with beta-barrel domain n=1 Tax=Arenicella xantha TaxID=644221 RepID=A0A395JPH8_9GAMM|nr:outer membrane beta-barrel protein [Arenicella xantha]RBP50610.1 outer membrane protein with beta-barrel domain [Arenicella xantha]
MKKIIKLLVSMTLIMFVLNAQAEKLFELSAGQVEIGNGDTEFAQLAYGFELESYPVAVLIRLGAALDDIENETNLGLGGEAAEARGYTSTLSETAADLKFASLLASPDLALTDNFSVYGLAGYSLISADVQTIGRVNGIAVVDGSLGEIDGGYFSYGAGLRLNFIESFSIKAEYFALSSDISTTSVGFAWHF